MSHNVFGLAEVQSPLNYQSCCLVSGQFFLRSIALPLKVPAILTVLPGSANSGTTVESWPLVLRNGRDLKTLGYQLDPAGFFSCCVRATNRRPVGWSFESLGSGGSFSFSRHKVQSLMVQSLFASPLVQQGSLKLVDI